jgi:Protein of unknown function (DUF2630)
MSAYENVVQRIYKLSAEQHKIYLAAAKKELTAGQRKRLAQIKEDLNKLWLTRKGLRPRLTDNLEILMQSRWNQSSARS